MKRPYINKIHNGEDFMILNETERQNLILHILNKVKVIGGYSKFYNTIYLLKEDNSQELADYKFDNHFLTIKDNVLDNDLNALILAGFISNDHVEQKLAHEHELKIKKQGNSHLKLNSIDKKFDKKFGKTFLKNIDKKVKKYNDMTTNSLMMLVQKDTS